MISVEITDTGEHWYKRIRLFSITIYYRHDYTEATVKPTTIIGFKDNNDNE